LAQATKMRVEAKSLLAEAERLEGEVKKFAPNMAKTTIKKTVAKTATKVVAKSATPEKRGPGRPKKVANDSAEQKTT
jgi:hypothetical protein